MLWLSIRKCTSGNESYALSLDAGAKDALIFKWDEILFIGAVHDLLGRMGKVVDVWGCGPSRLITTLRLRVHGCVYS